MLYFHGKINGLLKLSTKCWSTPSPWKIHRGMAQCKTWVWCRSMSRMYFQTRLSSFACAPWCACRSAFPPICWGPLTSFPCRRSFLRFVFVLASSCGFCSQFGTLFDLLCCNSQLYRELLGGGTQADREYFYFLPFPAFPCFVLKALRFHTL